MSKKMKTVLGIVVMIVATIFGFDQVQNQSPGASDSSSSVSAASAGTSVTGVDAAYHGAADKILDAFQAERSDMWIEGGGTVQRTLADDSEGSRHQRFIVRLANKHTILIAHNIDLAQRVPLKAGDPISFYGEYEWNEQGGVVHWTHHDPGNRREGGWIRHKGTTYR